MKTFKSIPLLIFALIMISPATLMAEPAIQHQADTATSEPMKIKVYKSPSCGCCSEWETHLEQHQFIVTSINHRQMSLIKKQLGVPQNLQSCHTAIINGYLVEGHVPAADIKQMVTEKPDILGISVPHMPVGTPGMEMGDRKDPFKVFAFDKDGHARVIKEYRDY